MTGASQANGLGSAKAPEPHSGLRPAGAIPSAEKPKRTVASLSRLEKKWLKRRMCSFCEVWLTGSFCGAHSGLHTLPIIKGVRDKEEVVDLGPPCNMDERRAHALLSYRPRAASVDTRRMVETGTGSMRSTGSAVPERQTPDV